jgi:simple sugar transport system substrate-binding protein
MGRRDFLKKVGSWTFLGAGMVMCGEWLTACSFLSQRNEPDHSSQLNRQQGNLVFANKSLGYYFFIIQQEAIHRAAQSRGWGFQSNVADLDSSKQDKHVKAQLDNHPLAIIMDPVDSEGMQESLRLAEQKRIPIGVIDTPLTNQKVAITIAFDNFKAGEMAAEKVVSLLEKKYGEPTGMVLNCYGQLKSAAWNQRKEGFESVIQKHKKIKLISRPTEGDLTKMHEVTYNILNDFPNLDAVHAPSETPARGIYEALKEKGRINASGTKEHIIFVSIDGEPIAHQWIKEGVLDATISQDPIAYGEICVEMLDRYALHGKAVPIGDYSNSKYYWGKAQVIEGSTGPCLTIPPFEVNMQNVNDKRLWGNIAFNEWGIKYY